MNSNEHWSNYWSQGAITSLSNDFKDNYEGAYRDFWKGSLIEVPEGFNALDIGCGNGALGLLFSELLPNKIGKVTGCDLAEVKLPQNKLNNNVEVFLDSHVNCEKLPYMPDSFDIVVSQYGIEYSCFDLSLREVFRVLRKGGKGIFFMHFESSIICQQAENTLKFIDKMNQLNVIPTVEEFCISLGELKDRNSLQLLKGNKESEIARGKLNKSLNSLMEFDKEEFHLLALPNVIKALRTEYLFIKVKDKLVLINDYSNSLSQQYTRLQDLKEAAIKELRLPNLLSFCEGLGFIVADCNEIKRANGDCLGWAMTLEK